MSILPSPLKSPTFTSTQVTPVDQAVHGVVMKAEPLDRPTHQFPVAGSRAAMSVLPSPSKSPVRTSAQGMLAQLAHWALLKAVEPLDRPTHTWPEPEARPTMSLANWETTLTLAEAVAELVTVSVTVTDCGPADLSVTVKV